MVVYFVQRKSDGAIKIGYSKCLKRRCNELKMEIQESFDILCIIDGGRPIEKMLHKQFSNIKVTGEWFSPKPELIVYITSLSDQCLSIEDTLKVGMPFVVVHLRLSEAEYAALREKKEKETWETFFLRLAGV